VAERMHSVDAAWLRMDRPGNAADIVALFTFDEPLPFRRLSAVVEDRLLAVERFRQRIVPCATGGAAWEADPGFHLRHHLRRARLGRPGQGALRDFVGRVATEPLAPDRAPWQLWGLDGVGRGSAVVAKLHHCIGDGLALVSLLLSLTEPAGGESGPLRFPALPFPDLSARALGEALRDWRRTRALASQGAAAAAALARMVLLPRAPDGPLLRPASGRRRVAWSRPLPLGPLREAARARGATVNDLLLAALAGGLRGHLQSRGARVDGLVLRALVPVNLRDETQAALGNRFGLVFVELPVGLSTPAGRLEAVRARMKQLKAAPDAAVTYGVLWALGRLPAAAEGLVSEFFSSKASLVVTNVPGPDAPLALGGREIGSLMFWVPHPSLLGLGVSLLSYAGAMRVGVRADESVMRDPGDLVRRAEAEVALLRRG